MSQQDQNKDWRSLPSQKTSRQQLHFSTSDLRCWSSVKPAEPEMMSTPPPPPPLPWIDFTSQTCWVLTCVVPWFLLFPREMIEFKQMGSKEEEGVSCDQLPPLMEQLLKSNHDSAGININLLRSLSSLWARSRPMQSFLVIIGVLKEHVHVFRTFAGSCYSAPTLNFHSRSTTDSKMNHENQKVFALYLHTHACVTGSFINGKVDVQDVDECTELCIINGSCRTVSDIWLEKGQSRDFILVPWFSLNQERKCGLIQEPCMASKRSGSERPWAEMSESLS